MDLHDTTKALLLRYQRNEITEHHIYRRLAALTRSEGNRKILEAIAADELRHHDEWKSYTHTEVKPDRLKIWLYVMTSRLLGLTFSVKLMERGEGDAQENYGRFKTEIPRAGEIAEDESRHEESLLRLLDEERLKYTGSMVLGLNDALVELTGALAGFTLALPNTRLVALTGSITGFAAALSMASSEYLSTKSEDTGKNPLKASLYTGTAYLCTVILLILPFLLLENRYICLGLTLLSAILVITLFNFYISVAKDLSFRSRFLEMTGLSLGVALLSFGVGYLLRTFIGIDA